MSPSLGVERFVQRAEVVSSFLEETEVDGVVSDRAGRKGDDLVGFLVEMSDQVPHMGSEFSPEEDQRRQTTFVMESRFRDVFSTKTKNNERKESSF